MTELAKTSQADESYRLGTACLTGQDYPAALKHFAACLDRQPAHQGALFCRASALRALGQSDEAAAAYQRLLALYPENAEAWCNLGNIRLEQEAFEASADALQRAISIKPELVQARYNLANLAIARARLEEAAGHLDQLLASQPDFVPAWINLGHVLSELGRYDKALDCQDKVIQLDADNGDAWLNRANSKKETGDYQGALADYRQAERLAGRTAVLLANRGDLYLKTGQLAAASQEFDAALKRDPASQTALLNRGNLFKSTGNFSRARQDFETVLRLSPAHVEARFNLALIQLQAGQFSQGWQGYEARWDSPRFPSAKIETRRPLYDRKMGRAGRLLLWAEQGIGDEIMFASLFGHARQLADQLIIQCDPRLISLFGRSFADITFLPRTHKLPAEAYDCQLPIGSLPGLFLQQPDDFASLPQAYLLPDPDRLAWARRKLVALSQSHKSGSHESGPVWGISWQSHNRQTGARRSFDLPQFLCRIGRRDVVYVNLQYQPSRDQIEQARQAGFQVLDIPEIDNFSDIEGLAALIKATDQLVTIDNMVVHLAGALGAATQLWLPSVPEWRWGNAKEPCRWYPSVELQMMDCCAPYFWNPVAQDLHPLCQPRG